MKLYTYYNSRLRCNLRVDGNKYFRRLEDAKQSARDCCEHGELVEIKRIDIGPISSELVMSLLNEESFVNTSEVACTVTGEF